jgi:hypothetical protein
MWSRGGLRYRFAHMMEQAQLRTAQVVITVTQNHREDLVSAGMSPERVRTIPSITDLDTFRYRDMDRAEVRRRLGIPEKATVGIYVGKFGGLYYDEEAFRIFARAFDHFHDLHVVVLSPMDPDVIRSKSAAAGIPPGRFHVLVVPHVEVPAFLSAADFAFSTIKPSPVKKYQCPIKNGEYWANGLPILMSDGIADDHKQLRKGMGGSVFAKDLSDLDEAFGVVRSIVDDPGHKEAIVELARKYKSVDIARTVYAEVI